MKYQLSLTEEQMQILKSALAPYVELSKQIDEQLNPQKIGVHPTQEEIEIIMERR